jgi:hypothetical protein
VPVCFSRGLPCSAEEARALRLCRKRLAYRTDAPPDREPEPLLQSLRRAGVDDRNPRWQIRAMWWRFFNLYLPILAVASLTAATIYFWSCRF